jgi:hypothetical protein
VLLIDRLCSNPPFAEIGEALAADLNALARALTFFFPAELERVAFAEWLFSNMSNARGRVSPAASDPVPQSLPRQRGAGGEGRWAARGMAGLRRPARPRGDDADCLPTRSARATRSCFRRRHSFMVARPFSSAPRNTGSLRLRGCRRLVADAEEGRDLRIGAA